MILHLLCMRRNVNRNVFIDRKKCKRDNINWQYCMFTFDNNKNNYVSGILEPKNKDR